MPEPFYARNLDELVSREELAKLSGLDFLQGIVDGRLPAPPIAKTLDYRLDRVSRGEAVFRGTPGFAAMNPIGSVHGGWFGTLLDSCMACAVQSTLEAGFGYTTLEYKINIIRPLMPSSGEIEAIGTVSHVGRRTGVAEGRIVGREDGKLYATGSTTCIIMDLRA
ncbi:MAG: PaaI family thioesterase [Pseudomonadota bacterium]